MPNKSYGTIFSTYNFFSSREVDQERYHYVCEIHFGDPS